MQKYLKYAGIAFVAFYLFTQPAGAASFVNGVIDKVEHGANSLAIFVNKVG